MEATGEMQKEQQCCRGNINVLFIDMGPSHPGVSMYKNESEPSANTYNTYARLNVWFSVSVLSMVFKEALL